MKLSNKPVRGTTDWNKDEFKIRKYIFDTWRKVCERYGYGEYLTPILENADLYRAKSGDELGNKQLLIFQGQDIDLAIRPEMTPSVTRLVTQFYNGVPKPLKLFSIANFWRNEKPQKGRNREFWQLNIDIFGEKNTYADIELLQIATDLMLAFGADENMFAIKVNNRNLVDFIFDKVLNVKGELKLALFKLIDKWEKLSSDTKTYELKENLKLDSRQEDTFRKLLQVTSLDELLKEFPDVANSDGYSNLRFILDKIAEIGYNKYIQYSPKIVRGIDYYDGIVFEAFDKNPENRRALLGGGRYNGLASIFGIDDIPAVGFGVGDETFKLFLQNWSLLKNLSEDKIYYVPLLADDLYKETMQIARRLRNNGKRTFVDTNIKNVGKALKYANKINANFVVLFGSDEKNRGIYKIKDMASGKETIEEFKAN